MRNSTLIAFAAVCIGSMSACSKKAADANTGSTSDASAPAPVGDASWSMTLDGVAVTGSGVDDMQLHNAAFLLPVDASRPKHLIFYLFSTKNGADESANYSMRFSLPPKAGTYDKKGSFTHTCDCDIRVNTNIAPHGDLGVYDADVATVTLTSMTATRIAGTFSGSFALGPDTPGQAKKRVIITNGKFDIPMSTSKMTPE